MLLSLEATVWTGVPAKHPKTKVLCASLYSLLRISIPNQHLIVTRSNGFKNKKTSSTADALPSLTHINTSTRQRLHALDARSTLTNFPLPEENAFKERKQDRS